MNNVELLVKILKNSGIENVFGVPSGPVLPLIEALRNSDSTNFVLTASETSAAFMAETSGRLSGIPGVCVSTLGPGATNLSTGVGGAWLDESPLIAIVCTYKESMLERRTQMRIDHLSLFSSFTKGQIRLSRSNFESNVRAALELATKEPPGPVLLELPEDVGLAPAEVMSRKIHLNTKPETSPAFIDEMSALLSASKRPLVVTGQGFTRTRNPLRLFEFLQKQRLPYVSTLHAKGFLPESYVGSLGVIGRARRTDVKEISQSSDLIIAIGYDPVEINYEEWLEGIPVAHLSWSAADSQSEVEFVLDTFGDLDSLISDLLNIAPITNEWSSEQWVDHQKRFQENLRPLSQNFTADKVLDVLRKALPDDSILTYDVGAHTHQIASQWRTDKPNSIVATNGWSSMGYGMPSAYAAKLLYPDHTVVGVVGDGCFQMTVGELATARRLNLKVPIIVLNDGWLGLMKVKQEKADLGIGDSYLGAPFTSPSNYFGVPCHSADGPESFAELLTWALSINGPSVIEVNIDVESYSSTVFD